MTERGLTLDKIVEIGPMYEVRLQIQMKVMVKTGFKSKQLSYSFPTLAVREPSPDRGLFSIGNVGGKQDAGNQELMEKMKALEEENNKMRD